MRATALSAGLVVFVLGAGPGEARAQTPDSAAAPCVVAADPAYGRSAAMPAQVGGSPLYGGARQRRYLETLRGPAGQTVAFKRLPAVDSPDGEFLIDRYEVSYDGLARPEILFLDWYRYTDLRAPSGFTCAQPFNLGIPPPDPFMAAGQLERLALADPADAALSDAPVRLGGDGPQAAGAAFDHFRLLLGAARAAAKAGARLSAESIPKELARPRSVVVIYPQSCGGRTVPAATLVFEGQDGRQAAAESVQTQREAIVRLMPGAEVPEGSVAAVFGVDGPRIGLRLKAVFPAACSGTTEERLLELTLTPARLLESPMPTRPAGDPAIGTWIAVQAIVDHAGRFREAAALGGAPDLVVAALEALSRWRVDPPRVNGAPLTSPVVLQLTFQAAR